MVSTLTAGVNDEPEQAVESFLKKYYKQDSSDMMDLQVKGLFTDDDVF